MIHKISWVKDWKEGSLSHYLRPHSLQHRMKEREVSDSKPKLATLPNMPRILPRQSPLWESILADGCPLASLASCHWVPSLSPRLPAIKKKRSMRDRMRPAHTSMELWTQQGGRRATLEDSDLSQHLRKNKGVKESTSAFLYPKDLPILKNKTNWAKILLLRWICQSYSFHPLRFCLLVSHKMSSFEIIFWLLQNFGFLSLVNTAHRKISTQLFLCFWFWSHFQRYLNHTSDSAFRNYSGYKGDEEDWTWISTMQHKYLTCCTTYHSGNCTSN